jgi:pimeloyl-ACP methyl ester carboxylesterase
LSDPEHRFVRANGLRFHVAELGDGERLALCLHGFPECWYSWRHQMPLLAELGWRVWAPDLRGYGGTERPPRVADYAIEILMDDVAGLVDASGAREVMLLSHDWGAIVAWYFAMRRLRPLSRCVVMNVPHPAAAEARFRTLAQLRRSWYVFFFQIPWLPEKLLGARGCRAVGESIRRTACHPERFPDEVLEVFRRSAAGGTLSGMIHYYRALVRGGAARQRRLGYTRIETPTLFLWGEQDVALGLDLTRGTGAWVSDLTFRSLPGASHWVQQDEPERVNAMLSAWLRGEPVPEAPGAAPGVRDAVASGA